MVFSIPNRRSDRHAFDLPGVEVCGQEEAHLPASILADLEAISAWLAWVEAHGRTTSRAASVIARGAVSSGYRNCLLRNALGYTAKEPRMQSTTTRRCAGLCVAI